MNDRLLFVNHRRQICGVHEFGNEIFSQITASKRYHVSYVECETVQEFLIEVGKDRPAAVIFNYHPTTMSWGPAAAAICADIPSLGIIHDVTNDMADAWNGPLFSRFITHDPDLNTRNSLFSAAPRPLPQYRSSIHPPACGPIRIGSFGFAALDKGFDRLVLAAQDSFEQCVIRLHIPVGDFVSTSLNVKDIENQCRALIVKPGISIEVSDNFLRRDELLDWLASNHINALFYHPNRGLGGISSAADLALASGRPLALRRGNMFRCYNKVDPSVFIDDLPLHQILSNGTLPLQVFTQNWTQAAIVAAYDDAITRAIDEDAASGKDTRQLQARMLDALLLPIEERERRLQERLVEMHAATKTLNESANYYRLKGLEDHKEMAKAESRINAMHEDVNHKGNRIFELETIVNDKIHQIRDLEKRINNKDNQASKMRGAIITLEATLQKAEESNAKKDDQIADLQKNLGRHVTELRRASLRAKVLEDELHYPRTRYEKLRLRLKHRRLPVRRFNTMLDNAARAYYGPAIQTLWRAAPTTMQRKIPEANVQQGFMLSAVEALCRTALGPLLCVGAFEDTAAIALRQLGYVVDSIDPETDVDLAEFRRAHPEKVASYQVVFSTSVIEHVLDDEQFVRDLVEMTALGGAIVLTCDFCETWKPDQQKPSSDCRIYTTADMQRLMRAMPGTSLVDSPDWSEHATDFSIEENGGVMRYGFATLAARRIG
ncbi:MAG: hypothetical protein HIU92_19300 [Proteobacteria bacterium]|nr:hypothetical protein [Pseudomonadota bacterium]